MTSDFEFDFNRPNVDEGSLQELSNTIASFWLWMKFKPIKENIKLQDRLQLEFK